MQILDRIASERAFHDRQAASRAESFRRGDAHLKFDDAAYLDHEPWIRPAFEKLGNVCGRRVLDLGCGHGMASVVLARRGASVTAVDLSPGYVAETRARAAANDVKVKALVADGESLPFDNASFDAVWGSAILHHLELPAAARELKRVLKPQGVAVFCEPWGGNPFLKFARRRLPYPGKQRTPDERPLEPHDVAVLREYFPSLKMQGFQFLGMLSRLHPRLAILNRIDRRLFRVVPNLEKNGRYVVLTLSRD